MKFMRCEREGTIEAARRELAAMEAVKGAPNCVTLLYQHDGLVFEKGQRYLLCAMRCLLSSPSCRKLFHQHIQVAC